MQKTNYRISQAALGRHLANTICLARENALTPDQFQATMMALYESCISEKSIEEGDVDIDRRTFDTVNCEIEKSARRSLAARKAAERRRMAKKNETQTVSELLSETAPTKEEDKETPVATTSVESDSIPETGKKKRSRRRRRRKKGNNQNSSNITEGQPDTSTYLSERSL